jgi:LytR cell envelope-related transcriptional attenuator/Tetratricopeptide repeat
MDKGGMKIAVAGLMLATASCGEGGKLEIRSTPTPFASGTHAVSFRVAEAQAQFALGNVGLALEGYRKALREDPASIDALGGLAACYDQMGRFDLSRRYYESALAVAPGDARTYANLAASLDLQGKRGEAAAVRKEMAQRMGPAVKPAEPAPIVAIAAASAPVAAQLASPKPPTIAAPVMTPAPVQVAPARQLPAAAAPMPARTVTVALAPPRPAKPTTNAPAQAGPRLERLSLGEVALVTSAAPLWRAQLVERSPRSATIGFRPLPRQASVILLNAARSRGLAARTRAYLTTRGWSRIAIGDAPRVLGASTIFYPASRRATAIRLANQFGFTLRHQRSETGTMTIMLGRDAATDGNLRASRG